MVSLRLECLYSPVNFWSMIWERKAKWNTGNFNGINFQRFRRQNFRADKNTQFSHMQPLFLIMRELVRETLLVPCRKKGKIFVRRREQASSGALCLGISVCVATWDILCADFTIVFVLRTQYCWLMMWNRKAKSTEKNYSRICSEREMNCTWGMKVI